MHSKKVAAFPKWQELHSEALSVLIKELGITKTAFFIRNSFSTDINYVDLKNDLFANQTADMIYENIKVWKRKK